MKKLTSDEQHALIILSKYPSFVPGDAADSELGQQLVGLLKSLVRKGRATVSDTDDGPSFKVSAQGQLEVAL